MFNNNNSTESHNDYFTTNSTNKIETILPQCEYSVNFKFDGIISKKTCTIAVDKIDLKQLIQIRISDKDHRKLYISNINLEYFNVLKVNQSIHVTFTGFIENLMKFFKECNKGNLQMILTRHRDDDQLSLQFYEAHSFKNLIHLNLPIEEAPQHIINFHLNKIIDKLQKQNQSYVNNVQDMKNDLKHAYDEISHLKSNNMKFREQIAEQRQEFLKRQKDELDTMQENIKKLTELKDFDEIKYKKSIVQLQSRNEIITLEKTNALKEKSEEVKKNEANRKEILALKANISNLKLKNDQLANEIAQFQTKDQNIKANMNNMNKKSNDLNEKLMKLQKLKSELEAELEAEKKICKTKRDALEIATEEISKANQIISKQCVELSQLKKTIDWRTEVALQQEIAVKSKEETVEQQKKQLLKLEQEMKNIRDESMKLPQEVLSIKNMVEAVESKYKKKITDMKKALPI